MPTEQMPSSSQYLCLRAWEAEDEVHVCKRQCHEQGWHVCMCTATLMQSTSLESEAGAGDDGLDGHVSVLRSDEG